MDGGGRTGVSILLTGAAFLASSGCGGSEADPEETLAKAAAAVSARPFTAAEKKLCRIVLSDYESEDDLRAVLYRAVRNDVGADGAAHLRKLSTDMARYVDGSGATFAKPADRYRKAADSFKGTYVSDEDGVEMVYGYMELWTNCMQFKVLGDESPTSDGASPSLRVGRRDRDVSRPGPGRRRR